MTTAADAGSGKSHRDENFPVASRLIAPHHRAPILAFYGFVRAADDVADHPALAAPDKLALIDRLEATLLGRDDAEPAGVRLRGALTERGLSPRHAQDLLTAFRLDVTKRRYRDWDDLLGYCAYSAMPVGRFVLDVHGEDRGTWAANDALCAALQVINHLQDCALDYRRVGAKSRIARIAARYWPPRRTHGRHADRGWPAFLQGRELAAGSGGRGH
jgi:hydroxysqualene synthase